MKIQNLAIIFILIMLPISLVISVYTQNQIKTLNLQSTYDSKLIDSTHDAIKAFQLNTLANSSSDVAASKIRDIEASANTFFNSVANNFGLKEYNADVIKEYIPAIVFTLYDGYYIYSPYTNNISQIDVNPDSTYQDKNTIQGLKPYVYYSCRYTPNSTSDFVITYTLDNYITIQGNINGQYVNKSGYLLDNIKVNDNNVTYRGISIENENLSENVVMDNGSVRRLQYVQLNGVKYYLENRNNNRIFSIVNGKKIYLSTDLASQYINRYFNGNDSAKNYYIKAEQFTNYIRNNPVLKDLKFSDAVDENGISPIKDYNGNVVNGLTGNKKIFEKNSKISVEDEESNFNEHRTAVIRYAIQKNLSIAIANFNDYSSSTNEFQMPELSETDWYRIINNVSVMSFLQGVSIGGKIYNGYAVVTNNKTQEVVSEDSIYIVNGDNYSRINEKGLNEKDNLIGYFNVDFERKSYTISINNSNATRYCYPHNELASYLSVVNQTSVESYTNIHDYLNGKNNLAKAYYTALGRERYSMYRVNYDNYINFES